MANGGGFVQGNYFTSDMVVTYPSSTSVIYSNNTSAWTPYPHKQPKDKSLDPHPCLRCGKSCVYVAARGKWFHMSNWYEYILGCRANSASFNNGNYDDTLSKKWQAMV